jgi:hypothetical protein
MMIRKSIQAAGLVLGVSVAGLTVGQHSAQAIRVTAPASACMIKTTSTGWGTSDPLTPPWVLKRYDNGGVSNPDIIDHDVECPVVFSGDTGWVSTYVDGDNVSGTTTNCTLFDYDYKGNVVASGAISSSVSPFDFNVALDASSTFDYFILRCSLRASNRNTIRGVTAGQ